MAVNDTALKPRVLCGPAVSGAPEIQFVENYKTYFHRRAAENGEFLQRLNV